MERMAVGIGAKVRTIESGHTVMLSRPRELAAMLNEFAVGVFGAG